MRWWLFMDETKPIKLTNHFDDVDNGWFIILPDKQIPIWFHYLVPQMSYIVHCLYFFYHSRHRLYYAINTVYCSNGYTICGHGFDSWNYVIWLLSCPNSKLQHCFSIYSHSTTPYIYGPIPSYRRRVPCLSICRQGSISWGVIPNFLNGIISQNQQVVRVLYPGIYILSEDIRCTQVHFTSKLLWYSPSNRRQGSISPRDIHEQFISNILCVSSPPIICRQGSLYMIHSTSFTLWISSNLL